MVKEQARPTFLDPIPLKFEVHFILALDKKIRYNRIYHGINLPYLNHISNIHSHGVMFKFKN